MNEIKVLLVSANYPNQYHIWAPWNKEANIAIANSENIIAEILAPIPYSISIKFFPYNELSKIPLLEEGTEGWVHRPRFLYLLPKKIFYGFEGYFYRSSVEKYSNNLQKPDLIHCHSPYPDGYGFINLCEKWDVPLIIDIHKDTLFTVCIENKALSDKVLKTLNFASKIICISEEIKNIAIDYGINEEKLEFIPLGVDINSFKPRDKEIIKENLSITKNNVILYVGQLIERKGLDYLVKAISSLPDEIKKDLKVIIIGIGEEKKNLDKLCKKLQLSNIFEFRGSVDRDKIPYYYSITDIFVLPSLSEGRPVVIYEAMASESAIIATKLEGISEQIKEGYNGLLVEPKNYQILANKIEFLLENEDIRNELGKNARKSIFKKNLTWNDYSKHIINIYNELLGRN